MRRRGVRGGGGGHGLSGVPAPLPVIKDIDVFRRQRVFTQVKGNLMLVTTQAHALCAPCRPRAKTWEVTGGRGVTRPPPRAEKLRLWTPSSPSPGGAGVGRGHLETAPFNIRAHTPGLAGSLPSCLGLPWCLQPRRGLGGDPLRPHEGLTLLLASWGVRWGS